MAFLTFKRIRLVCILLWFCVIIAGSVHGTCRWTGVERIVAVGDVHGDYQQFLTVLKMTGLIDDTNAWTGGKTHLVQTGDILDRGPESYRVLDLLMNLEGQAEAAGGMVHTLVGNHEAMVLTGDYRYVHPDEVKALGGSQAFTKIMNPVTGKYGRWIAGKQAVIIINDTLFVHGGISDKYVKLLPEEINRKIKAGITTQTKGRDGICWDTEGPLWYRGLASRPESELTDHMNAVCRLFNVNRLVVGHTVSKDGIISRVNGRIIMIDVGMSRAYGGPAACLVMENNGLTAVYTDRRTALPVAVRTH